MCGHLSLEMWLLQPSFRFRCILVTTETVPRGHSARRGAGSQAATRSLPTLRPSRHRALRVPWRHSLLVSAPYVPGSVQRSSAQGLPWLWRSCVFLSSDWLLGLVGDRFDPSDPRTPAGSAGTPPRNPPVAAASSESVPSQPDVAIGVGGDVLITGPLSLLCLFLKFSLRFYIKGVKFPSPGVRTSYGSVCCIVTGSLKTKSSFLNTKSHC